MPELSTEKEVVMGKIDDGGPAYSGEKIRAWYLPGKLGESVVEMVSKAMDEFGIKEPIFVDPGRDKVEVEKESYNGMSYRDWMIGRLVVQAGILTILDNESEFESKLESTLNRAEIIADKVIDRKRDREKSE